MLQVLVMIRFYGFKNMENWRVDKEILKKSVKTLKDKGCGEGRKN